MIAHRMKDIDASGIRKVFDLAAQMKNPVNLSIGQPDFDVPGPVIMEFKVEREENVVPMVPAGKALNEMVLSS